jgi:hypothetical protein
MGASDDGQFDQARAEAFSEELVSALNHGALCLMVSVWHDDDRQDGRGESGHPATRVASGARGVPESSNSRLVYFHCEDCATEAGRVVNAGGHVHKEKCSIGEYGFITLALDTEGNMFGLHSRQ